MEHTLASPWTFYYFLRQEGVEWSDMIHKIGTCETCEQFWAFYSHMRPANEMKAEPLEAIHLFRGQARAIWEDEPNRNGGVFRVRVQKSQAVLAWERLIVNLVAGQLPDDILGVVLAPRTRFVVIQIWTSVDDEDRRNEIFKAIAAVMRPPPGMFYEYYQCSKVIVNDAKVMRYALNEAGEVQMSMAPSNTPVNI